MRPDLKSGNFCLEGHIDVPEDKRQAVAAALDEHIALTRAEPGCIYFHVDPDVDIPGRYLVSEAFVDAAAFEAHQIRAKGSRWAEASSGVPRSYQTSIVE